MIVIVGEETFFKKKAFFPHTPIFKEIATGSFLLSNIVRSTIKQLMFAQYPRLKVFAHLFQKVARVKGRVAPYILTKTQEWVNSFATQRKRENPRRGFSLG